MAEGNLFCVRARGGGGGGIDCCSCRPPLTPDSKWKTQQIKQQATNTCVFLLIWEMRNAGKMPGICCGNEKLVLFQSSMKVCILWQQKIK